MPPRRFFFFRLEPRSVSSNKSLGALFRMADREEIGAPMSPYARSLSLEINDMPLLGQSPKDLGRHGEVWTPVPLPGSLISVRLSLLLPCSFSKIRPYPSIRSFSGRCEGSLGSKIVSGVLFLTVTLRRWVDSLVGNRPSPCDVYLDLVFGMRFPHIARELWIRSYLFARR